MALTELTDNVNVHQSLPDQPALNAEQLKQEWDKPGNIIKDYINQVLTKELDVILDKKVEKITGKVLSSNDFTDALKTKLVGIADNANNYSHPTSAGNKHIPAGGASGQILRWSSAGTATWGNDNNTTYTDATQSKSGLMSTYDKKKIDGIVAGATRNIIKTGTANPSGGSNGDIYIQYY